MTKASNCVAVVDVLLWLMLLCVICLQPTIYEINTVREAPGFAVARHKCSKCLNVPKAPNVLKVRDVLNVSDVPDVPNVPNVAKSRKKSLP